MAEQGSTPQVHKRTTQLAAQQLAEPGALAVAIAVTAASASAAASAAVAGSASVAAALCGQRCPELLCPRLLRLSHQPLQSTAFTGVHKIVRHSISQGVRPHGHRLLYHSKLEIGRLLLRLLRLLGGLLCLLLRLRRLLLVVRLLLCGLISTTRCMLICAGCISSSAAALVLLLLLRQAEGLHPPQLFQVGRLPFSSRFSCWLPRLANTSPAHSSCLMLSRAGAAAARRRRRLLGGTGCPAGRLCACFSYCSTGCLCPCLCCSAPSPTAKAQLLPAEQQGGGGASHWIEVQQAHRPAGRHVHIVSEVRQREAPANLHQGTRVAGQKQSQIVNAVRQREAPAGCRQDNESG